MWLSRLLDGQLDFLRFDMKTVEFIGVLIRTVAGSQGTRLSPAWFILDGRDMSGFEAWTETGYTQLNADFRAFHLRQRIDFYEGGTLIYNSSNRRTRQADIYFQANNPMVAWVSNLGNNGPYNGPSVALEILNNGGGNWIARVYANNSDVIAGTLWIYDNMVPTGTNAGLELFLPDGSYAFSSGSKPMRVVGLSQRSNNIGIIPTNTGITIPPGRQYAAIQMARFVRILTTVGLYFYGCNSNGYGVGSLQPCGSEIIMPLGNSNDRYIQNGAFIYVDVTGH